MAIYTDKQIKILVKSGKILRDTKELLKTNIKPGITLSKLNDIAHNYITSKGATPSFLNYNGFKGSICTSVNDVLIHGVPNEYVLQEGDIISIDTGVYYEGYHTDSAFTMGVGQISKENQNLLDTTAKCLSDALAIAKDGVTLGEIGRAIEKTAKKKGYYLTKDFAGHGLGKNLHEDPFIFNVEKSQFKNVKLEEGMVVAIEPMLTVGTEKLFIDPIDNWSVRTINGQNAAHEEHSVVILKDGVEILT